jgi:hypothetical protein
MRKWAGERTGLMPVIDRSFSLAGQKFWPWDERCNFNCVLRIAQSVLCFFKEARIWDVLSNTPVVHTMIFRLILLLAIPFTAAYSQTVVPPALKDKFPQLRVTPKVPTKRDEQRGTGYMEQMTISPNVTVESSPTAKVADATATMIIITMDTKEKYVSRREVFNVHAAETISIPAVDRGGKREFEFKPTKVRYDAYRDATNIGGAIYKWYIFGLRDAATKQILHFETNNTQLTKHVAANPGDRDRFLSLAVRSEFSENFKSTSSK